MNSRSSLKLRGMKLLFILGFMVLTNMIFAQNVYDKDETEWILKYYGFTEDQRKEKLIVLSDSGHPRAMYYLAKKYNHPAKSSFKLIKESAEKAYFMAECELGRRYIQGLGCTRNQDSAYYWLKKAIEHTEPFIETDVKRYFKNIKDYDRERLLSIEYERIATFASANSILSQYYMEKGQKEQGLNVAKIGYALIDKIFLEPKGTTPNLDYYKELLEFTFATSVRYMAVVYYIIGDIQKGNKIWHKSPYRDILGIGDKEPLEYIIARRIDALYNSKSHPLALNFYQEAVEKKSYLAMGIMLKDPAIQKKIKRLAFSGDSIAAMVYLHYQLEEGDTISANLFLKELPFKFNFSYTYTYIDDNLIYYVLSKNDVCFLLLKNALHTDVETILSLINSFIDKSDYKNAVSLYEVLLSQHPNYSPAPLLKRNISACYYNLEDYSNALSIMTKICDTYPDVSFRIGEILYEGYTGVPDYDKVFKYLKRAEKVKKDNEVSQLFYYLGMCYLKGKGVPKDEVKGFEYLKKSVGSKRVYTKVFLEISKCYKFERGVKKDLKRAEYYEQVARKYGDEDAKWLEEQQDLFNSLEQ